MSDGRKTALITGAGRGIGREIALGLAREGYNLSLVSRTAASLEKLSRDLSVFSGTEESFSCALHRTDVTDFAAVERVVEETVIKFGQIDLLVNSAGIYTKGTLGLSVPQFEEMLRVNLTGSFAFMKAALPAIKRGGYIINIASRAGKIGFLDDGGYVASKFGLVGLNESVYRESSAHGIKVTAICPGWTNTEMAREGNPPLTGEEMIQPSDILKTILWLLGLSPQVRVRELVMECEKSIF
jgi:NAD(P)-dependent dehydrogenase (short-subunit alcohol dehydrogenase family)